MRIADKFTLSRIVLAPVVFLLYFIPKWTGLNSSWFLAAIIPVLGFAEFTDFLDGFFARKKQEVSDFGKLFDPFADVLLHLTTFFCFVVSGYMPAIVFLLVFYREFAMIFVRLIAAKQGVAIAARKGGKLKTVLYVVTGFYYFAVELFASFGLNLSMEYAKLIGLILCLVCLIASYVSFCDYLVHFLPVINKKEK